MLSSWGHKIPAIGKKENTHCESPQWHFCSHKMKIGAIWQVYTILSGNTKC